MEMILRVFAFLWKVYVGIVFAIFAIILYPFLSVMVSNKRWKKKSFYLFVFWSWMMRIFCFYHVRKMTKAKIPKGPYVIISNHSSYLDIFLMHSIMSHHPFLFLGKSEILNYPIIKTYFKGLNIPVHRQDRIKSARSFIQAKAEVNNGWSIVIFPEGTIPDGNNPKMVPFKDGAFKLARALNIPIVPMTFTNNHILFSEPLEFKGTARPGFPRLYLHDAITVEQIASMTDAELSKYCYDLINGPIKNEYPELFKDELH